MLPLSATPRARLVGRVPFSKTPYPFNDGEMPATVPVAVRIRHRARRVRPNGGER